MKTTNFFIIYNFLKYMEYKELYKALEQCGGSHDFRNSDNLAPIVTCTGTQFVNHPFDVRILSISINEYKGVKILAEDVERGGKILLVWSDIESGHLHHITEAISQDIEIEPVCTGKRVITIDNGNIKIEER